MMMGDVGATDATRLGSVEPVMATVRESFAAFYERTYLASVRLAASFVDRTDIAEDIAQDAYAALYDRYNRVSDPVSYLRRCVINGCKRLHRRRRLALRRPSPAGEIETGLGYNHLLELVGRLPARQRAIVVLRYEAGLTETEIAATLGVAVGTVKSGLSRAKQRLRKEIE